jgi:hypothetical protein
MPKVQVPLLKQRIHDLEQRLSLAEVDNKSNSNVNISSSNNNNNYHLFRLKLLMPRASWTLQSQMLTGALT